MIFKYEISNNIGGLFLTLFKSIALMTKAIKWHQTGSDLLLFIMIAQFNYQT